MAKIISKANLVPFMECCMLFYLQTKNAIKTQQFHSPLPNKTNETSQGNSGFGHETKH